MGKTVAASVGQLTDRTTKTKQNPTHEESKMLNCEVYTDFGELGVHKGCIADVGYDSGEGETQIDIIYEDQDVETLTATEALQTRRFQKETKDEENNKRNFELAPMKIRTKHRGREKCNKTKKLGNMSIVVSPTNTLGREPNRIKAKRKRQSRKTRLSTVSK